MTVRDLANDILDLNLWLAVAIWPIAVFVWTFVGEFTRLAYADYREWRLSRHQPTTYAFSPGKPKLASEPQWLWTALQHDNAMKYGTCETCGEPMRTYTSSHIEDGKTLWTHGIDCPNFHVHPERADYDHESRPSA